MKNTAKRRSRKLRAAPGPKPELLKIKGSWKKAIRQSLAKRKPTEGSPK
jgi:hypothetical protein